MPEPVVRLAALQELPAVRALYAAGGYGGGVQLDDVVIVAMLADAVVGAVRLCAEHGVTVLRGMQVDARYQRRGIGRALLAACMHRLGQDTAYCVPYVHLIGFYASAGFRIGDDEAVPAFLRERAAAYRSAGQEVVIMVRNGDFT